MANTRKYCYDMPFELECGANLQGFELSYTTLGELNEERSNVIWVCHALTGNSNVLDWWPGLFGMSRVYNPEEYFIICVNMLGGCYGSTGPLSINPQTEEPYYHDFPLITNLDIIKAFDLLRKHLEINRIHTVIGGSMGGQQALEWTIECPGVINNLIGVATNARHSPWGIAFNESQRLAIANDPTWNSKNDNAGLKGMGVARGVALLSYRAYKIYQDNQIDHDDPLTGFKATSYQRYQGEKLINRFNAFTYWRLSEAMDAHNVGRNRGGIEKALNSLRANCYFIGVDSDILFPVREQQLLAEQIPGARLGIISSNYGHDGFLIETEKIAGLLKEWRLVG